MRNLVLSVVLLFSSVIWAQEVIELSVTETSKKSSATAARQDIFDQAIEKTSLEYIREILGDQKFEKNKDVIKNKILKNSGKYVLYIKGGASRQVEGSTEMDVTLKVSLKNLEALLLNEGLLYKTEGPPKALPMISIVDRVNSRSFSWWTAGSRDEKAFLISILDQFHQNLRSQLRAKGFFGLNPLFSNYSLLTPDVFRSENPPTEDFLFLGEFFKSTIVIRGYFILSPSTRSDSYRIDVKLMALHSANARVIAEVIRTYETEAGAFQAVVTQKIREVSDKIAQDLAVQLHEAWKSGTFGASLISLAVIGEMDYSQLQELKKLILTQVKDVKTLKERLFSPGRVVFEMDSSSHPRALAEAFKAKDFPHFLIEVNDVRSDGIDLKVKSL